MPLYEYRCSECDATLEAIQAFSAAPLEDCPECGRATLKKLLSAPAFQFKGSGWYVSDYARKGKEASTESSANGSSENGGGSETRDKAPASGTSSSESSGKSEATASSSTSRSSDSAAT